MQTRENRIKEKRLEYLKSLIAQESYRFKSNSISDTSYVYSRVSIIQSNECFALDN